MKRPRQTQQLSLRWLPGLLLLVSAPLGALELGPTDPATSAVQTRTFEQTDSTTLIRSCLAIIQDIRFQVIETESSPVLLVAASPGAGTGAGQETLTISLRESATAAGSYSIRLSLASPWIAQNPGTGQSNADITFYQNFFTHLRRELFREASLP